MAKGEPVYGVNTGFGKLASVEIAVDDLETLQRNIVLSHAAGVGETTPAPIVRLMMALKLASLAQGASGVRPETVAMLEAMLERDLIPVVPVQGSVGASGDLAPLAHMAAAMIGASEIMVAGREHAGRPGPRRGRPRAAGSWSQGRARTAQRYAVFDRLCAGCGLFEAEVVFQSALVAGALSTEAAKGSDTPFDARIHKLRGHRGQIETAEAIRRLMAGSQIRASHLTGDARVQDPVLPPVSAASDGGGPRPAAPGCRDAAGSSRTACPTTRSSSPRAKPANDEVLSGGNFHAEPVAFAADMIAIAICEIGSLSERRTAMLVDPALSGLPAFLTPEPGLNSGFMIPQVTAAALVSENKQRAFPASVDSIPTSANQEDHVSMSAHAARRLTAMAENAAAIVGIEILAAAQGCDFHAPLTSSDDLERVRATVRQRVPRLEDDRYLSPDLRAATALVREGALIAGLETPLPSIIGAIP